MHKITLCNGQIVETACLSCSITDGSILPDGGAIYESKHFHAHQDVAYPIRGLVILASKRHFVCLDEMNDEELSDYMQALHRIRSAQREALGIEHVYYFYNEDTTHHFHVWMVPRYEWMDEFGRSVESVRPVLRHARNNSNGELDIKCMHEAIHLLRSTLKDREE